MRDQEAAMLILREGNSSRRQWLLCDAVNLIGRGEDCLVRIEDRRVSRHHAHIRRAAHAYELIDLGSKNGTFVNGQRLSEAIVLEDGDEIGIAYAARLLFVAAGATAPLAPGATSGTTLQIDLAARRVWVAGQELEPPLSPSQFRLLELLYRRAGQVVSREEVVRAVWADDEAEGVSEQAIDALVRRLRERIAEIDPHRQYVATVRGHGYRLQYAEGAGPRLNLQSQRQE